MFGFPRQSRDSCTTRLYLPAHAQTKVPSVTLRCVRILPGVNSRAELVTLAPSLRPERRFAPLARGQYQKRSSLATNPFAVLSKSQISNGYFLAWNSLLPGVVGLNHWSNFLVFANFANFS